ncbi:efflux RND transporter periplasmic adaptor subunit [Pedobacter sp. BS3]|uniref:efflux RND transporter periplasmic adaptor subunit n=1 Tax=Pedobacter sp. BS3 TaxID=2567937 RepID=UPI0011EE678D|nr:efflux RND transporter periplasmic adaptor subunit [Pedobacter sp. BS3]TZF82631.1 efflux RND transporter periplasmic adaptor subunit [Pedobacter sp. BS3]
MKIINNNSLLWLAAVIISASSCSSSPNQDAPQPKAQPVQVRVETPSLSSDNSITVTGQVEPVHTAHISTRVMGFITAIKVNAGDHVSKGQVLVTISNEDILAKLAQADAMLSSASAAYQSAEKDYQRFTNLYNQKSASAKELDNVTLQYQAAKAGVRAAEQMKAEARAMLAYTNITAPFAGIVAKKLADAGSMANPGMPILIIEQEGNLQVNASVPETEISRIKLKSPAAAWVESLNKSFTGEVVEINPSSIGSGGQFLVKISLPQEAQASLYAGMYARVRINTNGAPSSMDQETVLVPLSAINRIGQLDALYTVSSQGTALLRYVRLGKIYGDKVEVLSGLNSNEGFIIKAGGKLYNGVPVKAASL